MEEAEFLPNPDYWTPEDTPNGLVFLGVLQTPAAPVYGSKPHFLDCDPSLRTAMEGIREPDRAKDDIFVDIEPVRNSKLLGHHYTSLIQITGSSLNVHQRLQLNINVTKTSIFFP